MATEEMNKYIIPMSKCLNGSSLDPDIDGLYCNKTWDTITCWEATPAGSTAQQPCPSIFTAQTGSAVYKTCLKDGSWARPKFWRGFGYSDYSECVHHLDVVQDVFDIQKEDLNAADPMSASHMLHPSVYILAITLLILSLITVGMTLLVVHFILPKSVVQTAQYRVSKKLFLAILLYTGVSIFRQVLLLSDFHQPVTEFSRLAGLCEGLITAEEYTDTVTYMWLSLQSYHLQHRAKSGTVSTTEQWTYCLTGWGIPVIPTAIWSVTLAVSHMVNCWSGYRRRYVAWIMESSKLLMMAASCVCLISSIRALWKNHRILPKSCCLRRTLNETKIFALYCSYVLVALVTVLIVTHTLVPVSSAAYVTSVMTSLRGLVLSSVFCTFNKDIRKLFMRKVRRQSRQELMRTSSDDNPVYRADDIECH